MELLSAGLIDLVFANEDEAGALLEVLAAGGNTAAAGEKFLFGGLCYKWILSPLDGTLHKLCLQSTRFGRAGHATG
jgi:hypothetical protein